MGILPGALNFMKQTHSAVIAEAASGAAPEADALMSRTGTEALAVLVADCVPVVLVGVDSHGAASTAVVHAGRRGVEANIAAKATERLRAVGARSVTAWIGPAVCGQCYEVPRDLQGQVVRAAPETLSRTRWGTTALDLPAGVRAQLGRAGAVVRDIEAPAVLCTLENEELFSHRAVPQGRPAGRMAGLVWSA